MSADLAGKLIWKLKGTRTERMAGKPAKKPIRKPRKMARSLRRGGWQG